MTSINFTFYICLPHIFHRFVNGLLVLVTAYILEMENSVGKVVIRGEICDYLFLALNTKYFLLSFCLCSTDLKFAILSFLPSAEESKKFRPDSETKWNIFTRHAHKQQGVALCQLVSKSYI